MAGWGISLLEKHIREETFYAKVQQEVKVIRGYCR